MDMKRIVRVVTVGRTVSIVVGLAVVAIVVSVHAIDSARRAAVAEAAWFQQRLVEKRALVRSLQGDLAVVAQATQRVSQMASIARERNVEVRRAAQLEDASDASYSPERLAALDDVAASRSEDGSRAIEQLAFLEEELAATTDSLSLMVALSKTSPGTAQPASRPSPKPVAVPAVVRTIIPEQGLGDAWPVAGEVSSGFGWRQSPYGYGTKRHTGLDIRADYGTPVRVSAGGAVLFAGRDSGGYGSTVVVDHGRGVRTLYGHLSGIYVREGDRVRQGTAIGAVGNTGRSTGVHLHYEVRVGDVPVDPMLYLKRQPTQQLALVSGYAASR